MRHPIMHAKPEQTTERTLESVMETALIQQEKPFKLSQNWGRSYSTFQLFQDLTNTKQQVYLLSKPKWSHLHFSLRPHSWNTDLGDLTCLWCFIAKCFHLLSARNVQTISSAGLFLQLHLVFTWSCRPPHTNTHSQAGRRSSKYSTGQDRRRPSYLSMRPGEGMPVNCTPWELISRGKTGSQGSLNHQDQSDCYVFKTPVSRVTALYNGEKKCNW